MRHSTILIKMFCFLRLKCTIFREYLTKNVVIISPGFADGEKDSSCIPFLQMQVNEFKNFTDINIQIISLQYPFESKTYLYNGIRVHAMGGQNKKGVARLLIWYKTLRLLKKLHKEQQIDVILSCWATESALIASRFAKNKNIKHICWIIGQDSKAENKYVNYISKSTIFVCKTLFIKNLFEKDHGITPKHVIPSGINLDSLPKINLERKSIDLIGAGSLIPLKRYEWFVELANDLTKKSYSVNCILIGDGPEKINLEKKILEYGLGSSFKLLGSKTHDEVIHYRAQSKILIHPSSFEGLSTVTLEALYAGCHVISYCRPFEEENAQMHYFTNYNDLLKKTEELLSLKELPFESQINYTSKKSAEAFVKLFYCD
jgi:glycosyltransferase involved in cell wall biosynthesis